MPGMPGKVYMPCCNGILLFFISGSAARTGFSTSAARPGRSGVLLFRGGKSILHEKAPAHCGDFVEGKVFFEIAAVDAAGRYELHPREGAR